MKDGSAITVIGAGLMGHGIAYVMAAAGHAVRVFDRSNKALESLPSRLARIADLSGDGPEAGARISAHQDLATTAADAEIVIEVAIEKLEVKQFTFAELEAVIAPQAVIASNTSAIPITSIAEKAFHPERVVGAHFWNPPHLVTLVEVVQAEQASIDTVRRMMTLLTAAGHHPVHVKRDVPGFVGNRLQHGLKREAIALVANGVCDVETVDDVVKHGFGKRLAVLGPLEQSDLIGLTLTRQI